MAFNTQAAYGMYTQNAPLTEVVRTLNQAGFGNEDICMMLSPTHPLASIVREASFLNQDREAGAVTASLIGWLSEFGAVVIPTVGLFIRSQAFLRALLSSKSSALCGPSSTLTDLGFSGKDAERYESQLRNLGVMVYVSCSELARTNWAIELLRRTGAREAATVEKEMAMEAVA